MAMIKQTPEDFYVEEIPKLKKGERGDYLYFILEKKNFNTMDVIKILSKRLKIDIKRFNVAGLKDKNAWTKQYVSVKGILWDRVNKIKINNVKLSFFGYGSERIKLGQIKKNGFRIIVRDIDKRYTKINFIENYFDEQRFRGKNAIVGKALVKREFRKICYNLRLKWENADYVNAIRKLGNKLLRFYINSYQSYLWNEAVGIYLKKYCKHFYEIDYMLGKFVFSNEKIKNVKVPIVGFLTEFKGEFGEIYKELMEKEGIKKEDFMIKEIKEISSEGNSRNMIEEVKISVNYSKDELRKNKLKAVLEFDLNSGSYATIVVKKMFH